MLFRSANIAVRERARANITDLNRALMDNAQAYDSRQVFNNVIQMAQIESSDLSSQSDYNVGQRAVAADWEKRLSADQYQQSLRRAGQLTEDQENFLNSVYLNQNRWSRLATSRQETAVRQLTMDMLLAAGTPARVSGAPLTPTQPTMELQYQPRPSASAFDSDIGAKGAASALTDIDIPTGGMLYSYRGVDALPDLTLRLRSTDKTRRLAASIAFIVIAAGGVITARRLSRRR
mgnify:CR=1 FL=1